MTTSTQITHLQSAARRDTHATHGKKLPFSNRQNFARLEIVVTHSEQSAEPISNRQFLRPFPLLPWIQLKIQSLQLQLPGHFHRRHICTQRPDRTFVALPPPEVRHAAPPFRQSFLISRSAIRNRRNPNKIKDGAVSNRSFFGNLLLPTQKTPCVTHSRFGPTIFGFDGGTSVRMWLLRQAAGGNLDSAGLNGSCKGTDNWPT